MIDRSWRRGRRLLSRAAGALAVLGVGLPALATGGSSGPEFTPGPGGLPFSEAVRVGDVLYLSGQIGVPPGGHEVVPGGIRAEARQALENVGAALRRQGLGFRDVFKCTVMLADMADWPEFNDVYVGYFAADRLPARSAFGAAGLALGGRLEIECWAHAGAERSPERRRKDAP